MPKAQLSPRKAPRQERARWMVEVILTAAARVLARESLAGFNTNRVAEVAGISIGSLYQYFPNKAALVTALIDRAQTELADGVAQVVDAHEGQPLVTTLHAVASFLVQRQYGNPQLALALDHEERRLPLQARLEQSQLLLLASAETLLQRHARELAPQLPASAAMDCLVITQALVEADAFAGRTPAADLPDRVVRALLGYLGWRAPKRLAARAH
jgi:AcrR family transcriptional regulator